MSFSSQLYIYSHIYINDITIYLYIPNVVGFIPPPQQWRTNLSQPGRRPQHACHSATASWNDVEFRINRYTHTYIPIGSMYGIFTYIWVIYGVNVGKYSIHGSYGIYIHINTMWCDMSRWHAWMIEHWVYHQQKGGHMWVYWGFRRIPRIMGRIPSKSGDFFISSWENKYTGAVFLWRCIPAWRVIW